MNDDERRVIEGLCRALNESHNELLMRQHGPLVDFNRYDWPEWTPQANSIRDAEKLIGKKLAKTNQWTHYPDEDNGDE